MKKLGIRLMVVAILMIIPFVITPFGYCGEGGPKDTERLVGPSIDAVLVLRHTHRVSGYCTSNPDGFIEGVLMGICNGNPFAIEGTCATGYILAGDLGSYTPEYLTNATTQLRLPAPNVCNPKPGQTLIVVTVKEFNKSTELDEITARVVLMFVEPK